ncbi:response regulator [Cohnella terricola]|uniref:Response regulator n=1 Tax=Cohnella terricola TaxID=1289167 RepID=A0A559JN83_9BACL|nr:response regulator [Cohnella terricola]TVY01339.1 response regulator [Cohnella terricola]
MRTLLIADDERNIRLGLKAMIEREYPGKYEIRLAADGKQALTEYESHPADIVLTDIRMPAMDGIKLIKQLAELPSNPIVLILSGYDDFQYAKEAIKHKVKEYLLKPIVREDLFAALGAAEIELAERESIRNLLEATDQYRKGMRDNTLRHIWARPDIRADEVEAIASEAGLREFEPSYYIGLLDCSGHQRHLIKSNEYLSASGLEGDYLSLEDKDGRLAVLTSREELLLGMARAIASSSGGPGTFAIGISGEGRSIAELRVKYEEAHQALKYRLLFDGSDKIVLQFDQFKQRDRAYSVPEEKIAKLANMMGTDREQEMKSLFMELFSANALATADIGYFEAVSRLLNERIFDQVFRTYGEASVEIIKVYKMAGSLYNFVHIQDYIRSAQGLLLSLNDYIRHLRSAHVDQKDMARALEYIQANYDKELSMTMVSNHVSLNYSYFSEAFKDYAGLSFVQYLKKLRIEKAKELLETTDLKVLEIGDRVGFENTKHFNRVFRESVGVSPLEYRQNVSRRFKETSF